jgi:hypothetical protein
VAEVSRKAEQAPGVVGVRLLGDPADTKALAAMLAALDGVEVIQQSGGRPNRYEPGERVYLTVRLGALREDASDGPAATSPAAGPEAAS